MAIATNKQPTNVHEWNIPSYALLEDGNWTLGGHDE